MRMNVWGVSDHLCTPLDGLHTYHVHSGNDLFIFLTTHKQPCLIHQHTLQL